MKYLILIFVLGLPLNLLGQESGDSTIDIILLGTFHYGQTTDANRTDFPDLFSERRQKELEALTNQLAKQNITKIFIERTLARQSKYDSLYALYLNDDLKDTTVLRPEEIQIGFRLAKKLNLAKVYCVDVKQELPYDQLSAFEEKHSNKQYPFLFDDSSYPFTDPKQKLNLAEQSLTDYYIKLNNPYHRKKDLYDYLHYAMSYVDIENDDYTGPDFSAVWYGRNLKIYANILNEIEKSDEAILILFGSSHAHIFNYFFSEHPKFNTMHLEDVLNE